MLLYLFLTYYIQPKYSLIYIRHLWPSLMPGPYKRREGAVGFVAILRHFTRGSDVNAAGTSKHDMLPRPNLCGDFFFFFSIFCP